MSACHQEEVISKCFILMCLKYLLKMIEDRIVNDVESLNIRKQEGVIVVI